MSWDSKFINFGVIKIDGKRVRVYHTQYNFITIQVGVEVTNASWAGGELNITLKDGKVRRYSSQYNFKTI